MPAKPFENSKKTAVILRLFESRWNGVQLESPMVNLQEVKEAIEALGNEELGKALSSRNPANFFKDFIRRAESANKNWPKQLKDLRWTAEQRTGENNCFEFVRYSADQNEPFEESFGPSATTPVHRMQSITIPKASRDLGRKDEQWLIQVAVQQGADTDPFGAAVLPQDRRNCSFAEFREAKEDRDRCSLSRTDGSRRRISLGADYLRSKTWREHPARSDRKSGQCGFGFEEIRLDHSHGHQGDPGFVPEGRACRGASLCL